MSPIPRPTTRTKNDVVLTTSRTVLRARRDADVSVLHNRVFGVSDVMKWVFSGKTFTLAESEIFVQENFSSTASPIGLSVLADRTTDEILGFAGLNRCHALAADDLEIGFVLAREAWGRGFAKEIGHAQLDFGFRSLGRTRLLALAAEQNEGSIRALEKLGMRYHSDVVLTDRAPRRVFCMQDTEWHAARRIAGTVPSSGLR